MVGIERLQELGGFHAHRPVFVAEGGSQGRQRRGGAIFRKRLECGGARVDDEIGLAALVGRDELIHAPFDLELADVGRGGRPYAHVLFGEVLEENLCDARRLQLRQSRQHRRNDARVAVGQHRRQARQRALGIHRSQNRRQAGTHAPMRIRIEPRQHRQKRVVVAFGEPLQRSQPDGRVGITEKVYERVGAHRAGRLPEREQRFRAHHRIEAARIEQLGEDRLAARVADARHGANRFEGRRALCARRIDQRQQQRNRRRIAQPAEALYREGSGIDGLGAGKHQQRGKRALVFDTLKRVGHRPPLQPRLSVGAEHRRSKRIVAFQASEGVDAQPERVSRAVDLGANLVGSNRCRGRRVRRHHLSNNGRRCGVVEQAERLGCAAGHKRKGIGHGSAQRLDRRLISDQAETECRHLSYFRIRVGLQQPDEVGHRFGQPDTADSNRRAPTDARFRVREQADQIGRRRRWRKITALVRCDRRRCNRHRLIAQNPLIFEAKNPRHFRLERNDHGRRQWRRPAGGGGKEYGEEREAADAVAQHVKSFERPS